MNDKQKMIDLVSQIKKQCDILFRKSRCEGCPMIDGYMCKIRIMDWDWEKIEEREAEDE